MQLHRKAGIHLIRVKKIKLKHPSPPNPCMNQQSWLQHPKALRLKPFPRAQVRTGHNKRVIKSPMFAVNCVSAGDLVLWQNSPFSSALSSLMAAELSVRLLSCKNKFLKKQLLLGRKLSTQFWGKKGQICASVGAFPPHGLQNAPAVFC